MATRAMSSGSTVDISLAANHTPRPKFPPDLQSKLGIKTNYKGCNKQMEKYKFREGNLNEFT